MESIKELRNICQKPSDCHKFESYWDNKIWRLFSIYITKTLLYTPLKPDHVTIFMIFWGFIVGFLFSFGTYWYMLIGAVFFIFLWPIDCVDGEMARYKKISSLNGIFLDRIAHLTGTSLFFVGLTIGIYRFNPNFYVFLAGFSASVFSILCLNIQPLKHHVFFEELIKHSEKIGKIKSKTIPKNITDYSTKKNFLKSTGKLINYLYDEMYLTLIILLAAIFSKLDWILFFYGLTFPLMWLVKLIHEYRIGFKPYEYLLKSYKK